MQCNNSPSYPNTNIDVGEPPYRQGWQVFSFKFHDFANLPVPTEDDEDESTEPVHFNCFDRNWSFHLYPDGRDGSRDGRVAFGFRLLSETSMTNIKFAAFVTVGWQMNSHDLNSGRVNTATLIEGEESKLKILASHEQILASPEKFLSGGTFTITLCLKQADEGGDKRKNLPYVPKNPCSQAILGKFTDSDSADILFHVREGGNETTTPTTNIYAHRFILQLCAPALADFCKEYSDLTPVPIDDVKPQIFSAMLFYVYGGSISSQLFKDYSREFIEAADKYGVPHLKIEAEAEFVKSTAITVDNVVENFLFADTKKCALLKEYVMEFLVENGQDVLNKISFRDIPGSDTLFTDFLTAAAMGKNDDKDYDGDDPTKFKIMSVNTLRKKLSDKELGIDGTREMLVTALEESCAIDNGKKRNRDENDAAET